MISLSLLCVQVKSSGRKNRANQRKLASLYSAGDVSRDLAKYNQFKVGVTYCEVGVAQLWFVVGVLYYYYINPLRTIVTHS